ncbi:MAG: lipopolysaccharide export system permease protein [Verrucomicrobiota bacterium]
MRLLDRYIIRHFLEAYFYCVAGFLSIWLIFDISDNINTFLDRQFGFGHTIEFYLTQLPQVLVILLPVSLLLALLFSLGRMSRTNEIVSTMAAGVSIPRMLLPLVIIGLLTTFVAMAFNYSAVPHAELARRNYLSNTGSVGASRIRGQIFRNRTDARTWFIQDFVSGDTVFNNVQILQQDAHDNIVTNYLAQRAVYLPQIKSWQLQQVKIVNYDSSGNILRSEILPELTIDTWSETPFRLGSANMDAEFMSFPELREYLHYNADFPPSLLAPFSTHLQYRLALPWTCLVVVLIATPLGIGFSRRGVLSSVAIAIVCVFSMNFLNHLFLALGEGYRIPAWVAAWTPNALFGAIGLYLIFLRATNRELWPFHALRGHRIVSR